MCTCVCMGDHSHVNCHRIRARLQQYEDGFNVTRAYSIRQGSIRQLQQSSEGRGRTIQDTASTQPPPVIERHMYLFRSRASFSQYGVGRPHVSSVVAGGGMDVRADDTNTFSEGSQIEVHSAEGNTRDMQGPRARIRW